MMKYKKPCANVCSSLRTMVLISLISHVAEVAFSFYMMYQMYIRITHSYMMFSLVAGFVAVPLTIVQILSYSFQLHQEGHAMSLCKCFLSALVHILHLGFIFRHVTLATQQSTGNHGDGLRILSILRLVHIFTSGLPVLVLLVYYMLSLQDYSWYLIATISVMLISVCWGLAGPRSHNHCKEVKSTSTCLWIGTAFSMLWRLGELSSRVTSIAVFSVLYQQWTLLMLFLHCVVMVFFVCIKPFGGVAVNGKSTLIKFWFQMMIAYMYIFCHIRINKDVSVFSYIAFYGIVLMETGVFSAAWLLHEQSAMTIDFIKPIIFITFITLIFGILSLAIYKKYFYISFDLSASGKKHAKGSHEHERKDCNLKSCANHRAVSLRSYDNKAWTTDLQQDGWMQYSSSSVQESSADSDASLNWHDQRKLQRHARHKRQKRSKSKLSTLNEDIVLSSSTMESNTISISDCGSTERETITDTTDSEASLPPAWLRSRSAMDTIMDTSDSEASLPPVWLRSRSAMDTIMDTSDSEASLPPVWLLMRSAMDTITDTSDSEASLPPAWLRSRSAMDTIMDTSDSEASLPPVWLLMRARSASETCLLTLKWQKMNGISTEVWDAVSQGNKLREHQANRCYAHSRSERGQSTSIFMSSSWTSTDSVISSINGGKNSSLAPNKTGIKPMCVANATSLHESSVQNIHESETLTTSLKDIKSCTCTKEKSAAISKSGESLDSGIVNGPLDFRTFDHSSATELVNNSRTLEMII